MAYHSTSRGGTTVILRPGSLFGERQAVPESGVIQGPEGSENTTQTRTSVADAPTPARKMMELRSMAASPTAASAVSAAAPDTSLRMAMDNPEWLNMTTDSYRLPSKYTTYACNVSLEATNGK